MLRNVCIVCAAALVASCGSTSIVGRRVENFTAYYNTFYNAERVFEQAEKATKVDDPPVSREVFIDVFPVPDRVTSRQNFENSIKKSADILREHENSKWIDDALLLIGKSYFYTQNYVSARTYFADVVDVSDKLDGEAQDWLGRTLLASGLNEEAIQHLTSTLAQDDIPRKTAAILRLQLGSAYVKTGDFESAKDALIAGTQTVKDKDARARAYFLLGQVFETLGDNDEAVDAYKSAASHKRLYELSFAAQFKAIELTAQSDSEQALRDLRRMERDDKNFNYRAKLSVLRSRVLAASGDHEEAKSLIISALRDNLRVDTESLGQSHYELGRIYENHFVDYPRAAAHYDTAATNLRAAVQQVQIAAVRSNTVRPFAPGAITDASAKAEMFGTFAEALVEVERLDSLLVLGSLDEDSFQVRIQELRRLRLEEMEEQRRATERRAIEQQFRNTGVVTGGGSERGVGKSAGGDGGETGVSSESGFLAYKDPILMRSGVQNFVDLWGTRPLVDYWRVETKLVREAAAREGGDETTGTPGEVITLDNIEFLPTIDVSSVPRTDAARVKVRRDRAESRYQVGNVLFLAMDRPDSARYWYNLVVTEDSEFAVSTRALFALTEASRAIGDIGAAEQHEQTLLQKYPDSEFARRIRGESLEATEMGRNDSTLIRLSDEYRTAFDLWVDSSAHAVAFDKMLNIAGQSPDSVLAPRALFASTSIYHDWARLNDMDPLAPIAFEIGDSIRQAIGLVVDSARFADAANNFDSTLISVDVSVAIDSISVDSLQGETITEQPSDLVAPDSLSDTAAEADAGTLLVSMADSSLGPMPEDSIALPSVYLSDILKTIQIRYPQSEFAQQARLLVLSDSSLSQVESTPDLTTDEGNRAIRDLDVDESEGRRGSPPNKDDSETSEAELRRGAPLGGEIREGDEAQVEVPAETEVVADVTDDIKSEPVIIGGIESVNSRLIFPEEVGEYAGGGSVVVEFVVTSDGFVSNPRVVVGMSGDFDREALRVLRETRFRPAINSKSQPVAFKSQIELEFAPVGVGQ